MFTTIQDVKEHVGAAVNVSVSLPNLQPYIRKAYRKYLQPWLTDAFYTEISTAFAASPSPDQTELIPYIQRPLAFLSLLEYSYVGSVQLSSAGLQRPNGEDMTMAYKYQENDYRDAMRDAGFEEIEAMLQYLETKRAIFTTWSNSTAATLNSELILRYASEFREVHSNNLDRFTYESLRSLIYDVEIFALEPLLGAPQISALKDKRTLGTLSDNEKTLLQLCRRSVAAFSAQEAILRNIVQITGNRIVQLERLDQQSSEKQSIASTVHMNLAVLQNREFANRHLSYVRQFLTDNEADFPLYTTYQEDLAAAAAEEETSTQVVTDPFLLRCSPGCGCSRCRVSSSSRKKIISL